ncbi:MAG TPA: hypothetical protein PLF31_01470 [Candidatus Paceibacterota bacterium]|nr:hypothetical protein [Candidatus Paceibacterota bacterium]
MQSSTKILLIAALVGVVLVTGSSFVFIDKKEVPSETRKVAPAVFEDGSFTVHIVKVGGNSEDVVITTRNISSVNLETSSIEEEERMIPVPTGTPISLVGISDASIEDLRRRVDEALYEPIFLIEVRDGQVSRIKEEER